MKSRSKGALVFEFSGNELRVSPVRSMMLGEHTMLGFSVTDIDPIVAGLAVKGLEFVRFEGFPHSANSIVTTPNGSRAACIRDPDGNLLSIVRFT